MGKRRTTGIQIRVEFVRKDTWIGVFRQIKDHVRFRRYDMWICVVPCLAIHITWLEMADHEEERHD